MCSQPRSQQFRSDPTPRTRKDLLEHLANDFRLLDSFILAFCQNKEQNLAGVGRLIFVDGGERLFEQNLQGWYLKLGSVNDEVSGLMNEKEQGAIPSRPTL